MIRGVFAHYARRCRIWVESASEPRVLSLIPVIREMAPGWHLWLVGQCCRLGAPPGWNCVRVRMIIRRLLLPVFLLVASTSTAEVVRIDVHTRTDVAGGAPYGSAGAYERLADRIYFEVDPALPVNPSGTRRQGSEVLGRYGPWDVAGISSLDIHAMAQAQ